MSRLRLLLITDAVGGVWVYSLELARALKSLGIEAVLAVMGPSPTAAQQEEAGALELIDTGLPLDWLETSPSELRLAADSLAHIASDRAIDVVQTSSAALIADAAFEQPCVAVQHSCVASWWAAVKGAPLPQEFVWRRELVGNGLNHAAAVVAPTASFAAETALIYELSEPALTVRNGRRPMPTRPIPSGNFAFTASRLWDEGKNVATLDRAAERLNAPFQAAGAVEGPNGARIGLEHVHVLGELGPDRLAGLLAARPVFASAALYEPFGLSVLEAAHSGCALVLSDIPSHRELWGEAAIFVDARDDVAFAAAIQALLTDSDRRENMGRRAQTRAQLYTPERMARGMAEIYDRVAIKGAPSSLLTFAGAA